MVQDTFHLRHFLAKHRPLNIKYGGRGGHYNKAEEFHEPSGTATGQDADKGSWPKHANMNDLADDDRVMLWQPEPATGLGNSLQV